MKHKEPAVPGIETIRGPAPAPEARPRPAIDLAAAENAIRSLLVALGYDPHTEHLRRTPGHVAATYAELLTAEGFELTTFPNDEGYDQLVLVRDIPFRSVCVHHMMPFSGVAHVGYLPGKRIAGLSKLARVVEKFARALQVQELLTGQIADYLEARLRPRGVGVVLDAEHQCAPPREVGARNSRARTSKFTGRLRDDITSRREFHALTGR